MIYKAINEGHLPGFAWMCSFCEKAGLPNLLTISNTLQDMKAGNDERLTRLEKKIDGLDGLVEDKVAAAIDKSKGEMTAQLKSTVEEVIESKVKEVVDKKLEEFAKPVPSEAAAESGHSTSSSSGIQQVPGQQISPGTHMRNTVTKVTAEMRVRDEIRNNLIIKKLPEPPPSSRAKREEADKVTLTDMFHGTLGTSITKDDICKSVRLGRAREDKSARPLLVTLRSQPLKEEVFTNVRKLKDSKYSSVSIAHDQTKMEREADKKLIAEAQKGDDASKNWGYRVKGPPWDRKVVRFPLKTTGEEPTPVTTNDHKAATTAPAHPTGAANGSITTVEAQIHSAPLDTQGGEHE